MAIQFASSVLVKVIIVFILTILGAINGYDYLQWEKNHNKTSTITNQPAIYIIHHPEILKSSKL